MDGGRGLADAVPSAAITYVVTVGADGRAHVAPARAVVNAPATVVLADLGRRTRTNLQAGSAATLVWSPGDPGAHTLIVDGVATVEDARCVVRPERAVLHRPGTGDGCAGDGCESDCIEVALEPPTT